MGDSTPDCDSADDLKAFFGCRRSTRRARRSAYHDKSDGGLLATPAEMMIARARV